MMGKPVRYYSYLLRLWKVPTDENHTCRILLESIQTGEKCSFGNPEELVVYLCQVLDSDQVLMNRESHLSEQG